MSFRVGHQAVSTMKPRSGNEYQKIDRNIWQINTKVVLSKEQ